MVSSRMGMKFCCRRVRSTGMRTEGGGGGWLPPKKGELGWVQEVSNTMEIMGTKNLKVFMTMDFYV